MRVEVVVYRTNEEREAPTSGEEARKPQETSYRRVPHHAGGKWDRIRVGRPWKDAGTTRDAGLIEVRGVPGEAQVGPAGRPRR